MKERIEKGIILALCFIFLSASCVISSSASGETTEVIDGETVTVNFVVERTGENEKINILEPSNTYKTRNQTLILLSCIASFSFIFGYLANRKRYKTKTRDITDETLKLWRLHETL